jgi:CO/xanthine dehydrogenase FAD-binding subunit
MISAYIRPDSLDEALKALAQPNAIPLAGGTYINTPAFSVPADSSVVDLQALGLDYINSSGNSLELGACTTLRAIREYPDTPALIKTALRKEAPVNILNMATIAGTLMVADGRSPLANILLALDARLTLASEQSRESVTYGELLPLLRDAIVGRLILNISIPLNVDLAWQEISRTPADKPIVCVSLARWPSGRVRMAVGGFGSAPLLGLDGLEADGVVVAARNALHEAGDEWGSAEYRVEMGAILAQRCLAQLEASPN